MKFVLPAHSGIVSTEEYYRIIGIKDGKKIWYYLGLFRWLAYS
jgi:hypothetical protein